MSGYEPRTIQSVEFLGMVISSHVASIPHIAFMHSAQPLKWSWPLKSSPILGQNPNRPWNDPNFFRVLNRKRSQWIKKYIIIIVINGIMDCSVVRETIKLSYFGPCKKLSYGFSGKSGDHFAGRIIPWLICKTFLYHLYNERGLLTGFLFFAEGNKRKMECIQEWFLDHIQVIDSLPIMILLIVRYMA